MVAFFLVVLLLLVLLLAGEVSKCGGKTDTTVEQRCTAQPLDRSFISFLFTTGED
jgi:predicted small integral membrane protein